MKKQLTRLLASLVCLLAVAGTFSGTAAAASNGERTIRVGLIADPGYAAEDGNGGYTGADVEYAYKIAQYAGIKIEIVLLQESGSALSTLDSGGVDMMCSVLKNADREEQYLFSEYPVGSASMSVFVRTDDDRYAYNNVEQLKDMTFGVEKGSTVQDLFTAWCVQRGFTPKLLEYDGLTDVKAAVDAGEVNAGVCGDSSVANYRTIQPFSPMEYYFAFRKADTDLKNQVDDAMGTILYEDPLYQDKVVRKYTSSIAYEMEALTNEEKDYVAGHPTLRVAVLAGDEPYYTEDRAGNPGGVIPDFYKKLASLTGISFTYQVYTSQAEAIAAIKAGDADILAMYSDGQIPAYNLGIRITRAYANVDTVLVTRSGTDLSDIKTIAVKNRSLNAIKTSAKSSLDAEFVGYDNASECFLAMKRGKADAMICGLPSATWLINQNLSSAYTLQTLTSGSLDLCAATDYGNSTLCSILSKAISASSYSFNEMVTKNTVPENSWQATISRVPPLRIVILAAALFVLVIVLVWSLASLRRRTDEKAAVLAQKAENERRENEIASLAKATDDKNRFFSNISHDMRTPLNAIMGFSDMARRSDVTEAQRNDYLDKIHSSGMLLLDLINDTLTMSKFGSGKVELRPEPISGRELFDSIVSPIRENAEKKHLHFTADRSHTSDRFILADRLNVQKIFLNLLSNSVKYTPEGGHVEFLLRDEPPAMGGIETVAIVRDDGIGISKEFLPHIFEPFAQEMRTGYESGGTGLGLSIVKQLVEMMGGTIAVESEKNQGTTFTVRLRFETAEETINAGEEPGKAPAVELAGKKVLLCEDNALNREIACVLLRDKGMEPVTAENGRRGVELFLASGTGEFSAVLMDLRMPVMGGYEAARRIRALPRPDAKTVPILAMTADAFDDDVQKCLKAGMDGHVAKPVEPETLYQALYQVLDR